MHQPAHAHPTPQAYRPAYFAQEMRSAGIMRENLRELNRSMESIEKMIQKSRRIINQSREANSSHRSIDKTRDQQSFHTITHTSNNTETQKASARKTVYKQISLVTNTPSNQAKPHPFETHHEESNHSETQPQTAMKLKQIENNQNSASSYKEIHDQGRTIYKFSPQKTSQLHSSLTKTLPTKDSLNRTLPYFNRESQEASYEYKLTQQKQNILIEQEQAAPEPDPPMERKAFGKEIRFKTECSNEENNDIYQMYKIEQPTSHFQSRSPRKKLNLKLFETESKKPSIISERSKKFTVESVKASARKDLLKDLQQLETHSATEEERKAKFILKIKKYGFVEKHLTQEEIWNIYDQLVRGAVPELKWPIFIVDEVYRRMKHL